MIVSYSQSGAFIHRQGLDILWKRLVVDEVGYTSINREECNLFFRFIANRYEKASTIITSNKAFSDWTELFHDPIIVTAILGRLLHHSVVINIKGNSYRLKCKAGKEELEGNQNGNG